jgi:hypothetical protein
MHGVVLDSTAWASHILLACTVLVLLSSLGRAIHRATQALGQAFRQPHR